MLSVKMIQALADKYGIPFEDILLIALNISGVDFECGYDRMRTALRLNNGDLFEYAIKKGDIDYYLAMPVHHDSLFKIRNKQLFLGMDKIGEVFGPTEDQCNSHYVRRNVTSINLNTNLRTSCRGCEFCYAAYQISNGEYRLQKTEDFDNFFVGFMAKYNLSSLRTIKQLSIVTGCYPDCDELIDTILNLKESAEKRGFEGRIFYLGSQIIGANAISRLSEIGKFGLCFSVEVFERRDILRTNKQAIDLEQIKETLLMAKELGFDSTISYVLGLESLEVVEKHFLEIRDYINKFPTINTLQIHRRQLHSGLFADGSSNIEYYLMARKIIERIFQTTDMRPLVWENYRGLWFMRFADEELFGCRFPELIATS